MRFDIRTLAELKQYVHECSSQDRLVIFTDQGPVRIRVWDEHFNLHSCDEHGNLRRTE